MMSSLDRNQAKVSKNFKDGSWLSNGQNAEHFYLWNTYYRRNLHRFAVEYLGLQLHWYQAIILYLMGISNFIVVIASRAAAKSFVIAIYACCKAILYPGSSIVLTSGTKGQSKLIVTKKIRAELMSRSPNLRREISRIVDNNSEVIVKFKNSSEIFTVTCSKNARGNRCTVDVGEEAREIDKSIMDTVVSPFQVVRQAPFMMLDDYKDDPQFREEPTEIFISSSTEESHWLYKTAVTARDGMFRDDGSFFVAFDYSITLKHGIRTRRQLIRERKKIDPITWMIEYENTVLRSNSRAYFTYDLVKSNQTLLRAFYPRLNEDVIARVKNKYSIAKQPGEVRVVACDIAAVDRGTNDNSSFTCLRLFEESTLYGGGRVQKDFRVQVPYSEVMRGSEMRKQAIRIRQLYDDFEADYIVLDVRNVGLAILDLFGRVLYDDERGVEYPPLTAMNDDVLAQRIINPSAEPKVFCIAAGIKLNSDIAVNLRAMLSDHRLDLLVGKEDGVEEIRKYIKGYDTMSTDEQLFYERPYLETMLMVSEMINLVYEKTETGLIRIREQGANTKDRYTSLSYGCYFASQLSRDLLGDFGESDFDNAPSCVSALLM